jgi:hypothetical protein
MSVEESGVEHRNRFDRAVMLLSEPGQLSPGEVGVRRFVVEIESDIGRTKGRHNPVIVRNHLDKDLGKR